MDQAKLKGYETLSDHVRSHEGEEGEVRGFDAYGMLVGKGYIACAP